MARAFIVARQKKLVGVFTSPIKVWNAIEEVEGVEVSSDSKAAAKRSFDHLLLPMARGEKPLTYSRLCAEIRRLGDKVCVYSPEQDEDGCNVRAYSVWQCEQNVVQMTPADTSGNGEGDNGD